MNKKVGNHENTKFKDKVSLGLGKQVDTPFKLEMNVHVQLFDENGNLKDEREVHNAVDTAGLNAIMDQILASPSLGKMTHMAIGTGTPGGTLLGAENARVAFTSKTRSGAVVTVVGTFGAGTGTGTITEAGTFDNGTANTVNRWMNVSFGAITKGASDSLVITWTLTGS